MLRSNASTHVGGLGGKSEYGGGKSEYGGAKSERSDYSDGEGDRMSDITDLPPPMPPPLGMGCCVVLC